MKKIIALILACLMLLPFAVSCAQTDGPATESDQSSTNAPQTTEPEQTEEVVTLNTMDISDFCIVYPDLSFLSLANSVKDVIKKKTGVELPTKRDTSEQEYEIIVGTCKRDVNKEYFENAFEYSDKYGVIVSGKKIFLAGLGENITKLSAEYFAENYLTNRTSFEIESKATKLTQADLEKLKVPAKEGENNIRFLTNNILKQDLRSNAARAEGILQAYAVVKPDVVALQECDDLWFTKTKLLDNMKLLGYELVISDDRINTPLLYNTSTLKLIESGFNSYEATDKVNAFRSYQWALLEQISTGKRFIAASTHLIAKTPSGYSTAVSTLRSQSASQATRELTEISKKYDNAPIIFGGDFNSNCDSSAYSIINAKLASARTDCKSTKNMTFYTALGSGGVVVEGNLKTAIDHVFYSRKGVIAKHYETLMAPFTYTYTDHLAVSFDFELE